METWLQLPELQQALIVIPTGGVQPHARVWHCGRCPADRVGRLQRFAEELCWSLPTTWLQVSFNAKHLALDSTPSISLQMPFKTTVANIEKTLSVMCVPGKAPPG